MPSRIDQIRLLNVMQIEEEKRLLRSLDDFFRLSMSGRDRRAGREEEEKSVKYSPRIVKLDETC